MISSEIGGGLIRQDVQEAIERELTYRLGEGEASSALSRWEKELLLLALNQVKPNALLSQLHARAAIKAGATIEQVREITVSICLSGMSRWKMAAMGALIAAEEEVARGLPELEVETKAAPRDEQRISEIKEYIGKVLPQSFGSLDMWKKLADVAPGVLDGFMRMRENIFKPDPLGALPKKFIELRTVGHDILQGNSWGAQMHVRQAIRDGATVPQVVETVALVMIEAGVPTYKTGGLEVIEAAEKEVAEVAERRFKEKSN